jgi:lysophospholipase L1-like esterase
MIVRFGAVATAFAVSAVLLASSTPAQEKKDTKQDKKVNKAVPADKPDNRDVPRHKEFLKKVASGEGDVIFLGDSITQGWEGAGKKAWADTFTPFKPVNLGIGGDRTGHVLWRITEGKELEPLKPKLAVIMIGTNNTGVHSAAEIAGGIKAIIDELRKQKPEMKILLLGVFPRGGGIGKEDTVAPPEKLNPKIKQINDLISKYADDKMVFYKDIGKEFLNAEGGLEKKIMPDLLHLSPAGYEIWAKAIKDDVAKLVK